MSVKKSFFILLLIILISSMCKPVSSIDNSFHAGRSCEAQISSAYAGAPSSKYLSVSSPYWSFTKLDAAGYSEWIWWEESPRHPYDLHEVLSGEWGAAVYYDGISTAPEAMWLTDCFLSPTWQTNSNFQIFEDPNAWDDPCNLVVGSDTGYSVIRNEQVEVRIDYEMVDLGEQDANGVGGSPLAFRDANGIPAFVYSERYVLLQTYTIKNIKASGNVTGLEFYQLLHSHAAVKDGPAVYSVYETSRLNDPLEDYTPYNPVHKVGNFCYDITQWNAPPASEPNHVDWVGFSSTVEPNVYECGYYEGKNGKPPSGTHINIEQRNLNSNGYSYGEVAGATGWYLGVLEPNDLVSVTVAIMLGTGPLSSLELTKVDDIDGCVEPGDEITYTICYSYPNEPSLPDINDVNIIDNLPFEVDYNSSDPCGFYDPCSRTVRWKIGTISPGDISCVKLTVEVNCPEPVSPIRNECKLRSGDYFLRSAYEYTPVCYLPPPECIIYVDANAPDCNNCYKGTSWQCPYTNLQDALRHAQAVLGPCPSVEIWVAEGTYKPDCNSIYPNGSGDREATFCLINNVVVYGGFPAGGGPWEARDPNDPNNETILSGDLIGNDTEVSNPEDLMSDPYRADNSYHVVTSSDTNETTVLDGFIITASNANGPWEHRNDRGGGMYNSGGSPTITNCTFRENSASYGGGMYNENGNPTITDCKFNGNYGWWGGGMSNHGCVSPTITNCILSGNYGWCGGGLSNSGSSPTIINCTFSGNLVGRGGGMFNYDDSNPTVTNCIFTGNSADYGGGMFNGGYSASSDPNILNCIFIENSADYGGGMWAFSDSTITNCTFSGNSADKGGGVYTYFGDASLTVTNCTFSGNVADAHGGGAYNEESSPKITNCTFSGNVADAHGGGMCNEESSPKITNCILWDDWAGNAGNEVYNDTGSEANFSYCDIRGCKDSNGVWDPNLGLDNGGNIDTDPCFVEPGYWANADDPNISVEPNDPNAIWVDGDYHLHRCSLCIDAGDPGYVAGPNEADIDGGQRIMDGDLDCILTVDMGADEFYTYAWEPSYLVVDNMDFYGDAYTPGEPGGAIFYVWRDGWDIGGALPGNDTGSQVYHWDGTGAGLMETKIVRSSENSMPFYYENDGDTDSKPSGGANPDNPLQYYSEAAASISDLPSQVGPDWTTAGVKALSLWFYGNPDNDATVGEQMYVALEDGDNPSHIAVVPYDGDMNDIRMAQWQEWNIDLAEFTNVNLANVQKIYIGFGDRDTPASGGKGIVYFDDIRLYTPRCLPEDRPTADFTCDCMVDFRDFALLANEWLSMLCLRTDLYEDGMVDFKDLAILADSWLEKVSFWP